MKRLSVILLVLCTLVSCQRDKYFSFESADPSGNADTWAEKTRVESEETRSVMLLYSAGFNSLAEYLYKNIEELEEGFVPERKTRADHILLVYSKLTDINDHGRPVTDYSIPTKSALFRMYKQNGNVVRDTIKVWGEDVKASDPQTLREVCQTAYNFFPAKSYGMVFTSHASGWLPSGYYNDPSVFEKGSTTIWKRSSAPSGRNQRSFPPIEESGLPVKSFGQDNIPGNSVEMELDAFANAIPFHMDYLLIDACLAGCVEVAYQFRGKADLVGFSQTEVLAQGFDYKALTTSLLKNTPDPVQVCKDYFQFYDTYLEREPGASAQNRSATISVVDTREMEPLAEICKTLFEKYREKLKTMTGNYVQGYFRYDRHFFYDLKDILVKAGITADEKTALQAALDQCIVYKAATDYFLNIRITTACGLSMYLPSMGSDFLDEFYLNHIAWNGATLLVK
jgi:hypothetical protein